MNIKKTLHTIEGIEPETVIYLLMDYYLYDKIKVNYQSNSTKIIILTKNNTIPEEHKKYYSQILYVEKKEHYFEKKEYEEIKNLLEKILKDKNKEKTKIVPCDEGYSYLAATLRKELNVPGMSIEQSLNLTNKIRMKDIIKKNNIPTHLYILISKEKIKKDIDSYIEYLKKEIKFPMFIKPTELFGSRGTKKINNKKELKKILEEILKDNIEYEMDEFVSDTIMNCEVIIIEGKIVYFRTRIAINNLHSFSNGTTYSSIIIPPSHQQYKKGLAMSKKVVEAFSGIFENRCINIEFIEQNQEKLLFLEINYRRPGAKSCYIFDYAYEEGFNYETIDLDLAFGAKKIEIHSDDFKSDYEFYSGSILFPGKRKGVIKAINKLPEDLTSDIKMELMLKEGDILEQTIDNSYIPAFIIIRNKCFKALYREIQRFISWNPYILE